MGFCTNLQKFITTTPLYIFNFVDFTAGGCILGYAIYLHIKKYAPKLFVIAFCVLAFLMMATAAISWAGVHFSSSNSCPGLLTCSLWLVFPVMLVELALAAALTYCH